MKRESLQRDDPRLQSHVLGTPISIRLGVGPDSAPPRMFSPLFSTC